jgi:hypothetical protein
MESQDKPLFDPSAAKRGKILAAACAIAILGATLVQAGASFSSEGPGLLGHLLRITLVVVCGMGAVSGISLGVFLLAAYASLAGTYLCIRSAFNVEQINTFMLSLGVTYFVAAILLSLSPAVSENIKQRRFRNVEL